MKKVLVVVLLFSAAVWAFAGGKQENSSSSSSSQSAASSSMLNVAVAAPFSGNEAFIGPRFLNGVRVAVAAINADGGVLGKKFRIVTADTGGDPVDAVPAISQIIATEHPVAVLGPSSLTITSVDKQLNQDKIIDITMGGTTQLDHMNFPFIFRTTPSDSQMGVAMAYYGIQQGYKKAALVFGSNSSAQTLVAPVLDTLKKHGVQVTANLQVVPDQSSYRSEIEKLLSNKPEVIFMQVDPQTASTWFSEIQQLGGGSIPVIGTDVTAASDFAKAIGESTAEKVLTSVEGSTVGGTAADQYAQLYGKMFAGKQPVALSNNAYDGLNIIALSMLEAKSTNPAVYVKDMMKVANGPGMKVYNFKSGKAAIEAGNTINYTGASGPEDFNQYHNVTGAFEAVQLDSSGKLQEKMNITPAELLGY